MAKKKEAEQLKEVQEQYELAKRYLDPVHDRMNSQEESSVSYSEYLSGCYRIIY